MNDSVRSRFLLRDLMIEALPKGAGQRLKSANTRLYCVKFIDHWRVLHHP
jgi:hypothetical protein